MTTLQHDTIDLCGETIPVFPQKIGRLKHMMKPGDIQRVISPDFDSESHRVLSILIPAVADRIPLWKWEGYGSQEAKDAGEYVESVDMSPTTDDIALAFQTALMVGGARRLGKIMGLLTAAAQVTPDLPKAASPGSPGSNGDGTVAASTTVPPTSTEN